MQVLDAISGFWCGCFPCFLNAMLTANEGEDDVLVVGEQTW